MFCSWITRCLQVLGVLLLSASHAHAGCPHAARMLRAAGNDVAMPKDHPIVPAPTSRKLKVECLDLQTAVQLVGQMPRQQQSWLVPR
jgi:hypothetical protein